MLIGVWCVVGLVKRNGINLTIADTVTLFCRDIVERVSSVAYLMNTALRRFSSLEENE